MPSLTIQILLAFLFVSVGFIGGALVALLYGERERRNAKNQPEPDQEDPPDELTPVAALWRDAKTGQLVTQVKGKYFETHDRLNPNQQLEMAKAVRDWRIWLGLNAETPVQAPPVTQPAETIRAEILRPATPARPPVNGVDTVIALPSAGNAVSSPADPGGQPTLAAVSQPRQAEMPPPPPPKKNAKGSDDKPVPMMSIVGQIDEILQEMVQGTEMEKLGIRLAEDPKEGVVVWIGLDHYFGIDSVPNPDALKLLRSAVAEWERRQEERIQATRIPKG